MDRERHLLFRSERLLLLLAPQDNFSARGQLRDARDGWGAKKARFRPVSFSSSASQGVRLSAPLIISGPDSVRISRLSLNLAPLGELRIPRGHRSRRYSWTRTMRGRVDNLTWKRFFRHRTPARSAEQESLGDRGAREGWHYHCRSHARTSDFAQSAYLEDLDQNALTIGKSPSELIEFHSIQCE